MTVNMKFSNGTDGHGIIVHILRDLRLRSNR